MEKQSEPQQPKSLPLGESVGDGASFNSKLLLFGEYGLMFDAMALSVPFDRFSGFLDFDTDRSHLESSAEIRKFYWHIKSGESFQKLHFRFDLISLEADLNNGLFFNSNIPLQYGVGSSGALVAALFSRYATGNVSGLDIDPNLLKTDFALLESYFHGRSSGVDPLISFLNHPMMIDTKKAVQKVDFKLEEAGLSVALIDTKTSGATGPLVQHFIDRFNYPKFAKTFETQFIPANNGCIKSLLGGDKMSFFSNLEQLIRFELDHFQRMFTGDFHSIIDEAIGEEIFIKLLGSGGGGFLIVFAESKNRMKSWSEKYGIDLEIVV